MSGDLVFMAERIARRAHEGQLDKAGARYIDHPRRVAERAAILAGPLLRDDAEAAAWLHDVVEDCDVSLDDLVDAGIPPTVLRAVTLVTKTPGQSPEHYFTVIRGDRLARIVKTADLIDNTNPERVRALDPETRDRLAVKYSRALQLLLGTADV